MEIAGEVEEVARASGADSSGEEGGDSGVG